VLNVLRVATRVKGLSQIVCVDDGSDDDTTALVRRRFSSVTVVELPENRGKAEAVRQGVRRVESDHVLLLDADLRFLVARDVSMAIARITGDPGIDMIILRRNGAAHSRICRGDVLFSGERILKTADLHEILRLRPERYQLEIAINTYMMDRRKTVYWMPSSAVNTYKLEKIGLGAGLARELAMVRDVMSYQGIGMYVKQYLRFAREQAPVAPAYLGSLRVHFWKALRVYWENL